VTGNATTSDARSYTDIGFTATLAKPFTMDALRETIEAHLV
jgi:hypothetical protein